MPEDNVEIGRGTLRDSKPREIGRRGWEPGGPVASSLSLPAVSQKRRRVRQCVMYRSRSHVPDAATPWPGAGPSRFLRKRDNQAHVRRLPPQPHRPGSCPGSTAVAHQRGSASCRRWCHGATGVCDAAVRRSSRSGAASTSAKVSFGLRRL